MISKCQLVPVSNKSRFETHRGPDPRIKSKDISATKVWFDDDSIWLLLEDGRQIGVPLAFYPRLLKASPQQRQQFETSGNGRGLHWEELNEDLSVQGIVNGIPDQTKHQK